MIEPEHPLGSTRQCALLRLSRSSFFCRPVPTPTEELTLMLRLDELPLEHPRVGSRSLRDQLQRDGLPVGKINGIGPKAVERLARLGIHTIGDVARAELGFLQEQFGPNYAAWLHAAAHGRDDRPVETVAERKWVSRETTFERDLHPRQDRAELTGILVALCERVAADLPALGVRGRTVGIKLRYEDFRILTRDHTLREPIDAPEALLAAARELGVTRAALSRVLHGHVTRAFRPRWPCASNAGWVWNVADVPKSGRECSSTTTSGVRATARPRSGRRVQARRPGSVT